MIHSMNRAAAVKQAQNDGYISTPGGFRRRSAIHRVKRGQAIVLRGNVSHLMDMGSAEVIDHSAVEVAQIHPGSTTAGGWMAWTEWSNQTGSSINSITTAWTVPPVPTQIGSQLIYLFNGLENPGGNEILQPVLQWGTSGAGGGGFWSAASWHVDSNGHAFCTPAVPVNPGDLLTGVMTQVAVFNDGTRNYRSSSGRLKRNGQKNSFVLVEINC